jgi:hypothetical protein
MTAQTASSTLIFPSSALPGWVRMVRQPCLQGFLILALEPERVSEPAGSAARIDPTYGICRSRLLMEWL